MPKSHKKLAIFLPSLRGGGAERVMVTIANELASKGHKVDLVLVSTVGPYINEVSPQVRVVDLRRRRVLTSILALSKYIKTEQPLGLLSALNHANLAAILARWLARSRVRLVISERSSPSRDNLRISDKVARSLTRHLYPLADHVIAVSQGVASELCSKFDIPPQRVTSIPNPIDLENIQTLSKEPLPQHWAEPEPWPFILAVGRLVPEKDYPTLLRAFATLKREPNLRLVILGKGPLLPQIEFLAVELGIDGSVHFEGFDANPFKWMAHCKAYVLSSRSEGFPNSLVQAMACNANVVSTDCPHGPREILEDGKWGSLVEVGNYKSLAAAIQEVLSRNISIDSLKRASEYSSIEMVENYYNVMVPQQ